MSNPIHRHVVNETWKSINKIVKQRSLTVLYRDQFTDTVIDEAKSLLLQSWSRVNFEILGDDNDKVILINLTQ